MSFKADSDPKPLSINPRAQITLQYSWASVRPVAPDRTQQIEGRHDQSQDRCDEEVTVLLVAVIVVVGVEQQKHRRHQQQYESSAMINELKVGFGYDWSCRNGQ